MDFLDVILLYRNMDSQEVLDNIDLFDYNFNGIIDFDDLCLFCFAPKLEEPTADAGPNQRVSEGTKVVLSGGGLDQDGFINAYSWTQTGGPMVSLQPSDAVVNPTFTAPLGVGTQLTFELTVDDGKESSAPDEVVVTVVENSQPTADAGPDQTVGRIGRVRCGTL